MTEEILDPLIDAADDAVDDDDEEGIVIEFMDEETGEKFYFEQEMVLEVNGERYALLVEITDDECGDHECDCGCGHDHDHDHEDEDEDIEYNIRFAKLVKNADGEDEYVEPTDEEFAAAVKAYDELWDDEDEE